MCPTRDLDDVEGSENGCNEWSGSTIFGRHGEVLNQVSTNTNTESKAYPRSVDISPRCWLGRTPVSPPRNGERNVVWCRVAEEPHLFPDPKRCEFSKGRVLSGPRDFLPFDPRVRRVSDRFP